MINTGTTIVTFLMVFLIQRAQNKDSMAIQLKLNELVAAIDGASNRLIDVEDLSEDELKALHRHYAQLAELAQKATSISTVALARARPARAIETSRAQGDSARRRVHGLRGQDMARAIWKGTVSFGPSPSRSSCTRRSGRPPPLQAPPRQGPLAGRVPARLPERRQGDRREDIVKGYQYEPGQFVVLTKDDFESAALEKSRTVHVLDFVKQSEIDHRFYDVPYYVLPSKGGEAAYAVLREASHEGQGRRVAGNASEVQHLAALGVVGDLLVLTLMRFADELVDLTEFHAPAKRDVRPKELQMARMLVDNLTSKWDPEQYKDDYNENLRRVIQSKMKGRAPRLRSSDAPVPANVVDLMERLKESLAQRAPARTSRRKAASARGRKRTKKVA